jgi:hypothetical protein
MIYAHTGESLKTAIMGDDPVTKPKHYTFGYFEVIDVLQDWFPQNPLLWQVGKYIARADHKGKPLEDLRKARFYLEREIDRREELSKNSKT